MRGSLAIAAASRLASAVPPRIRTRNGVAGEDVMAVSDDMPTPWLSIVGIGEDGLDGLSAAARELLAARRTGRRRAHGIWRWSLRSASRRSNGRRRSPLRSQSCSAHRGKRVVALCSGDPFWYGAGSVIADAVPAAETIVVPAPSTFAWAAARLRWRLEETVTLGLHARPIELLRPHLRTGARLIVLVRDGAAAAQVAAYLDRHRLWAVAPHHSRSARRSARAHSRSDRRGVRLG